MNISSKFLCLHRHSHTALESPHTSLLVVILRVGKMTSQPAPAELSIYSVGVKNRREKKAFPERISKNAFAGFLLGHRRLFLTTSFENRATWLFTSKCRSNVQSSVAFKRRARPVVFGTCKSVSKSASCIRFLFVQLSSFHFPVCLKRFVIILGFKPHPINKVRWKQHFPYQSVCSPLQRY